MRILVIRTSSMGDVALTTPVLKDMREQYPKIELLLLTMETFLPIFSAIKGLLFFFPDFHRRHSGIIGLARLYKDIRSMGKINYVIDLHDVLRSKILRFFFKINGIPMSVIDKGRSEKKYVINGKKKVQLKHTVERYRDVFVNAGYKIRPSQGIYIIPSDEAATGIQKMIVLSDDLNIGVAPYSKHDLKMWPEEYMISLLRMISEKYKSKFWLFGGKDERDRLSAFQDKVKGSYSVAGRLNLEEELALISKLDFMIAMDSANMHMAALSGTKVVSIWGGTDPLVGFGAWQQPDEFSFRISVQELTCRPCTVFGKGRCRRRDFACMVWLTPDKAFERMIRLKIF